MKDEELKEARLDFLRKIFIEGIPDELTDQEKLALVECDENTRKKYMDFLVRSAMDEGITVDATSSEFSLLCILNARLLTRAIDAGAPVDANIRQIRNMELGLPMDEDDTDKFYDAQEVTTFLTKHGINVKGMNYSERIELEERIRKEAREVMKMEKESGTNRTLREIYYEIAEKYNSDVEGDDKRAARE